MTTAPGEDPASRIPAPEPESSKELVHVPLSSSLPRTISAASEFAAELRNARREVAKFGQAIVDAFRWQETVRSLALVTGELRPETPSGPDLIWVKNGLIYLVQLKSSADRWARDYGQTGVFAALNARRAILNSRVDGDWKPVVDEFARTWLMVSKVTEDWLEAVSMALIGDWVNALDDCTFSSALDISLQRLKQESRTAHRQLQPLWERKTRAGRVHLLDHQLAGSRSLHDVLGGSSRPEDSALPWEPDEKGAATVFRWLKPDEQAVARAWAVSGAPPRGRRPRRARAPGRLRRPGAAQAQAAR
ncbi:hypothetical protein ACFWSJ_26000 [Streptomyces niveus]|uniref:hypothetical protein n=1 Tax=Streptomyces niveus TaxID=193462 RepID=UPI00364E443C